MGKTSHSAAVKESLEHGAKGSGAAQSPAMLRSDFMLNALLLLALVVIENANVLLTRYTRSSKDSTQLFKIRDMMLVTELCKVALAMFLESWYSGGRLGQSLRYHNFRSFESLKVALPAVLFFVQNSLFYVALTNLTAPVFQVSYQMKLFTTAVVSVLLLQRKYSARHWISLCTLTVGAALAVTAKDESSAEPRSKNNIGFLAVTAACLCSAFAGVGFEKLLKIKLTAQAGQVDDVPYLSTPSLWMRNIQLGIYSLICAILQGLLASLYVYKDEATARQPFLFGFSFLVWVLVLLRASCGILVAVIIKHMDNVVKSITSCISVLAGCLLSKFLLGTELQESFWLGTGLVFCSSFVFSLPQGLFSQWQIRLPFNSLIFLTIVFLTISSIFGLYFMLPNIPRFTTVIVGRILPSLPEDYGQHLHFIVKTKGDGNDCEGCKVLKELYYTLVEQGFSASETTENVPPNRTVVVIYPEVDVGTSEIGDIHVRWILAAVGINSAYSITESWNRDDLVFNYATSTGKNIPVSNVLQVVTTPADGDESDISDEEFYDTNRSGIVWMMRKGPKYHKNITPIHNRTGYDVTEFSGASVSSLRTFEYFITYDPYTYWTWFAAMQGVVSIVYPLANVTKTEWALGTFVGSYLQDQKLTEIPGVAYGWEEKEIEYARSTMHELRPFLMNLRKWGAEVTVPRFTRDCYRYSQGEREHFESAMILSDVYPDTHKSLGK